MRYIKLFENFDSFYKDPMYGILLSIDEFGGLSYTVELGEKLISLFNENDIEFRTYHVTEGDERFDPIPDDNYLVFFFNKKIDIKFDSILELFDKEDREDILEKITPQSAELNKIPKNIEIARITDNDIDFYFTANKYNL